MLPEYLSGSYSQYKEDTSVFATWLFNTARDCGYKHPGASQDIPSKEFTIGGAPASTRLKGKARKEAKAAEASGPAPVTSPTIKHTLPTGEIIVQARIIAGSKKPAVKVPLVIQGVLHRAIRARKRCTLWFQSTTSKANRSEYEASNSAHEYFIKVLERAFEILEPCFEKSAPKAKQTTPRDNVQISNPITPLSNRFEKLEVEDTTDQNFDISAAETALSTVKSTAATKFPKGTSVEVYELDRSIDIDLPFIVFCFFDDLHRIRDFIRQTWQQFSHGQIDLITASLVTNVALTLVRESEERIKNLSLKLNEEDSYEAFISVIHPLPVDIKSVEGIRAMLQGTPLDAFVFRHTFISMLKSVEFWGTKADGARPASVISISCLYRSAGMIPPEGVIEDDISLTQFLLDLMPIICADALEEKVNEARRTGELEPIPDAIIQPSPYGDELIDGLKSSMFKGLITVANVFQAHLLLDIQKIVGDHLQQPYKHLRKVGAASDAALGIKWNQANHIFGPAIPGYNIEELKKDWGNSDIFKAATTVSFNLKLNIKENSVVSIKQRLLSIHKNDRQNELLSEEMLSFLLEKCTGLERIVSSPDPAFLYNSNPVYCGMETLRLLISMEKLGVTLSNQLCSFAPMAHLYNALQQMKLLTESWPAMDRAIELNIGLLFNGSLPTTEDEILTRYLLCMKWPASAFARNHRGHSRDWREVVKKLDIGHTTTDASKHIEAYLNGVDSAEKLLFNLVKQNNKRSSPSNRGLSHLEMLKQLRESLPQTVMRIELDRITLARKCSELFRRIRTAFKSKLGIENVYGGTECAEIFEKWNYMTAMEIMEDVFHSKNRERNSRQGQHRQMNGESRLSIAAEVTRTFLSEVKSEPVVEPFDVMAATFREDYDDSNLPKNLQRLLRKWKKSED
jgi:hypothetical protein